jgi:hypothetical protein
VKTQTVIVRDRIIDQALAARTLPEIEQAARDLRAYMVAHPEDRSIADVGEPLALRRICLEQESRQAKAS